MNTLQGALQSVAVTVKLVLEIVLLAAGGMALFTLALALLSPEMRQP